MYEFQNALMCYLLSINFEVYRNSAALISTLWVNI